LKNQLSENKARDLAISKLHKLKNKLVQLKDMLN